MSYIITQESMNSTYNHNSTNYLATKLVIENLDEIPLMWAYSYHIHVHSLCVSYMIWVPTEYDASSELPLF